MYMYYCSISAIHRMGLLQGSDRIRKPRPWLLGTRASMAYEGVHIRKANPMDAFFDASVNGKKIHDFVQKFDADKSKQRVLESMDIFGGEGNFRKLCEKTGVSCKGIDILYDNVMHNFLTETGFFFILSLMLSVVSEIGLESFLLVVVVV